MVIERRRGRAEAEAALRRYWGHAHFREGQWEALAAVLEQRDTLAVLPTGGGKSLLYQLPAVLDAASFVLVVSPLVALMHDQVEALVRRGIAATAITGGLSYREADQRWTDAEFGRYRLVYVTPERLQTERFQARAARLPIGLLAVDEAHCISEWGHDFRPAYRRIAEIRDGLSDAHGRPISVLAVTATATPEVRRDIVEQLALDAPAIVVRGFDRPNLVWAVYREEDKARKVAEIAKAVPGSGLIYAGTREGAEAWAQALTRRGLSAEAYHAGLSAERRSAVRQRWQQGQTRFVTATSAFGMGIDKPDVRVVAHVALPPTLESYYQEAGRAGRDGARAYAVLLFAEGDERLPRAFAEQGHPDGRSVQSVYEAAGNLAQIPLGSAPDGPVPLDLDALAQVSGATPMAVRAAVERLAEAGVWQVVPERPHRVLLRLLQQPEALRRSADALENPALGRFVRQLLRAVHADAFTGWAEVDLLLLERRTGLSRARVLRGLAFLAERHLLAVHPPAEGLRVVFEGPRTQRAALDAVALGKGRKRALARLRDVLRYARSITCRRQHLLAYFGETAPSSCGRCDVCLGRHRPALVTPEDEVLLRRIMDHVAQGDAREAWLDGVVAPHRRDALADWLVAEGLLVVKDPLAELYALTPKALRFRQQAADA